MNISKLTITRNNRTITSPSIEHAARILNREIKIAQKSSQNTSKPFFLSGQPIKDTFSSTTQTDFVEKFITHIDRLIKNPQLLTPKEDYTIRGIIQSSLDEIKKAENIMGSGFHETVYRLNDKYAAKFKPSKNTYDLKIFCPKGEIIIPKNQYSDLLTYKGNILMQIGEFKILENLGEHIPAGLPRTIKQKSAEEYYINNIYLPKFADVSQESYNAILEDCGRLNDRYYTDGSFHLFDTVNPNNIVLKDGKLYWVDAIRTSQKDWNSITYILDMMLNKIDVGKRIYDGYGNSLNHARTIFKKIIIAGMNADVPVRGTSYYTNEFWRDLVRNLKINAKPEDVIDDLERIYETAYRELRVKKTSEYADLLFAQN